MLRGEVDTGCQVESWRLLQRLARRMIVADNNGRTGVYPVRSHGVYHAIQRHEHAKAYGGRMVQGNVLPRAFDDRDPVTVVQALLGKQFVRADDGVVTERIIETEAYLAAQDPVSHA